MAHPMKIPGTWILNVRYLLRYEFRYVKGNADNFFGKAETTPTWL